MSDDVLAVYTVYKNPADYPGQYVARRHEVLRGGGHVVTEHLQAADDLALVRIWIREHSGRSGRLADVRMPRSPEDHPTVLESWI